LYGIFVLSVLLVNLPCQRDLYMNITEVSFLEGGLRRVGKDVEEFDIRNLAQACKLIREWVEQATGDDCTLITEALQLK